LTAAGDVRVKALWIDDPTEAPLTVDLRVDAEGRVAGNWSVFGAVDLDGPHCAPFVLRPDGVIDFAKSEERCWRTDLRDHAIRVGEVFAVHWNERDSAAYKIVKIAVLGAKESKE
jgi:hypothetical protein